MSPRLLVIGYGNELRQDDGVGPAVANQVSEWGIPGVETLIYHQLVPELIEKLAEVAEVIFIDASLTAAEVSLQPVQACTSNSLGHSWDPGWLLHLSQHLRAHRPVAEMLSIPIKNLDHGTGFSDRAQQGVERALVILRDRLGVRDSPSCTK